MDFKLILGLWGIVFLMGCATTSQPSEVNRLQIKLAQLERQLDEKDQEISDLKNDMQDLSAQVENRELPAQAVDFNEADAAASRAASPGDNTIIRVSATPQEVQRALKKAGYYTGAIDGKIGSGTQKAISSFQKDNNLKSDGIIGRQTWGALKIYLE